MNPFRTVAIVFFVASAACAATTAPAATADEASQARSLQSGLRAGRCRDLSALARVEVFPVGLNPQRRFRALATVETGPAGSTLERVGRLQAQACALGADAVIGWTEAGVTPGLATSYADGGTVVSTSRARAGHVVASGIAVVYTDRADEDRQTAAADEASLFSDL